MILGPGQRVVASQMQANILSEREKKLPYTRRCGAVTWLLNSGGTAVSVNAAVESLSDIPRPISGVRTGSRKFA